MKILIIEDEPEIRQTLQDLLELNDHTVTAAANGRDGVKMAELLPDLILCDIGLPGLDGYEVLTAIQQLPQCRDIPFIFLTARSGRVDQRHGMVLGADDYITKPFSEREILDAIAARVRRLQPLRQRVEELLAEHRVVAGANWSHELMTPLSAVLGGLEMIEERADSIKPGELKELLGLIRAGAERQQVLSRKLIYHYYLERLKAAPPSPPRAQCVVAEAVQAGIAQVPFEEQRPADLTVRCGPGEVALVADQLGMAVAELVGNAFRFSQPGQAVTITGTCCPPRYTIDIIDQGPGMTEEQGGIMGPFIQFGRAKREQQGLGLGLAIARSVAELAGGRLTLKPGPAGRGLQVTLDLPGV